MIRTIFLSLLLVGCITGDPYADIGLMQQRLDERGMGFGITRVPGHDAYVFQVRFATSDTGAELNTDPQAAAQAAAPPGCTVRSVTPDGEAAYRVEYDC